MTSHLRTTLAFAAMLTLTCSLARAQATKPLLDLATAADRLTPKSAQTTVAAATDAAGAIVTVEPGSDPYPGVILKPEADGVWDLSAFGHVEARITNTSAAPLPVVLQVDNAGAWQNSPWNAEQITIKPGATGTVSVIFGYTYGKRPGYALKASEISRLLVFVAKPAAEQSFRIESITAAGPAGEKPAVDPNSIRIKPVDGVIFGATVPFDASKQIDIKGPVSAKPEGSSLRLQYAAAPGEATVSLKPAAGRWNLGGSTRIRVKLKNAGKTSITPAVLLSSDKSNPSDTIAAAPLPAGESTEIVVPFAPATRWKGTPSANIWKGDLSGEKTGSADFEPGTGTRFASDRTDSIKIIASHTGEAALLLESITAETGVATTPDWLGKRPPVEGEWTKTFDDDFTGTAVDLAKWNNEGPNYWDKISHWSKANVIVDGNVARLRYEKKTGFHNDDPSKTQSDFTGGYLDTFGKWRQKYGYFEARMKLPTAHGLWPAFWMMPDRGPTTPDAPGSKKNRCTTTNGAMEFDIMEQLTTWGPHRYNVAMHWDDYGPQHKSIGTGKIYFEPDKDGFVTAGLLWTPGLAVYYCNGIEVARWEDPRISTVHAYMIVYMPTGGWDNNTLDATKLPDEFVIDYVRCWQRNDLIEPAN